MLQSILTSTTWQGARPTEMTIFTSCIIILQCLVAQSSAAEWFGLSVTARVRAKAREFLFCVKSDTFLCLAYYGNCDLHGVRIARDAT